VLRDPLPDGRALELLEDARRVGHPAPCLIATTTPTPSLLNRAHLLGASCVALPEISANVCAFVERALSARASADARLAHRARSLADRVGLTPREREILELVARGAPRRILARRLGVSENTLKTHVKRLLAKAGDDSLEELARRLHAETLVDWCSESVG
jgi:DNA-binding NarL/FixJ family response regulator